MQVEAALEMDKIRMMDRLTMQKEQFEKVVEGLGEQVKAAMTLGDYRYSFGPPGWCHRLSPGSPTLPPKCANARSEREKMADQVNTLMDNINEAKGKGDDFNMREKVRDCPLACPDSSPRPLVPSCPRPLLPSSPPALVPSSPRPLLPSSPPALLDPFPRVLAWP